MSLMPYGFECFFFQMYICDIMSPWQCHYFMNQIGQTDYAIYRSLVQASVQYRYVAVSILNVSAYVTQSIIIVQYLFCRKFTFRGKCPNMSTLRKTATSNFIILSGHFKLMYIISYAYSYTETVFLS